MERPIQLSPLLHIRFRARFDRYFETDSALRSHWRSKLHKRRCKRLQEPAYTIEEAERAAGLGKEGKRPGVSTATTSTELLLSMDQAP
jgi:bud site selection protein 20